MVISVLYRLFFYGHVAGASKAFFAYLILIKHFQIFLLLPLFLIFSMMSGLLSGLGAEFLIRHLKEVPNIRSMTEERVF